MKVPKEPIRMKCKKCGIDCYDIRDNGLCDECGLNHEPL